MNSNCAIIGCGRIGCILESDPLRNKPCTHFGGALSAGLKFNYACDIDAGRLSDFAAKASISKENRFTDYKRLLDSAKFDLVTISVPTASHAEILEACIKKSVKVIICEKPLTADIQSSKKIIRLSDQKDSIIIVNHERRYDPYYRKAREIIKSQKLGRLISIRGSMLTAGSRGNGNPSSGGGPLLHDGTHLIDIIRYFAGDIKSVHSHFKRYGKNTGFEDYISLYMKTTDDVPIFAETGGDCGYFCFEVDIILSGGRIVIGNGYRHLYKTRKSKFYTGFSDLCEIKFPVPKNYTNCFTALYKEAAGLLANPENAAPLSTAIDGYKSLEIINASYLSSHRNKTVSIPVKSFKPGIKTIFGFDSAN